MPVEHAEQSEKRILHRWPNHKVIALGDHLDDASSPPVANRVRQSDQAPQAEILPCHASETTAPAGSASLQRRAIDEPRDLPIGRLHERARQRRARTDARERVGLALAEREHQHEP